MNIRDITITSLETINAFDVVTGAYRFTLDELQNATIQNNEEKSDITGKGGRKLSSLKRNKTATISGTNGMVSGGLLETQTGGKFENKVTEVLWTDYLTVTSNAATTTYKAVGTSGAEIDAIYVRNADGTLGTELTQASAVAAGKFTYAPATKALAFNTGDLADGTEIVAYYKRRITADTIDNDSEKFSGKCALYVDAMAEDKCSNVYRVQFYFPKADFNGEFSIEVGDNQTVHAFEAEALAGACNAGAGGNLWTYTVFGVDAADANVKTLSSIAITTAPTTTTYTAGESFSATGMVVTATYSDSTTAVLNAGSYTYAPNGALTTGDTTITVSYTEGGVTKTATQAITVNAAG